MRIHPFIVTALLACGAIATPANAQVFDTQFNAMIMNQNLGAMNTYNNNMDRLNEERRQLDKKRAPDRRASTSQQVIPDYVIERTQGAVLSKLNPEYKRRADAYGKKNADAWMVGAARNIGQKVGALGKEYLTRVDRQGRSQADTWYVARAGEISRQYVAIGAN